MPRSRSIRPTLILCLLAAVSAQAAPPELAITVDAGSTGPRVNPQMYGVFLEEINHGIDGGLYAELVRNRGFEDSRPPEGYSWVGGRWVDDGGFDSGYDEFGYGDAKVPFWSLWPSDDAAVSVSVETTGGVTPESSYCVRLEAGEGVDADKAVGLANEGFFGIGVEKGKSYKLSLNARGETYDGSVEVFLVDEQGSRCSDAASFTQIGGEWDRFDGTLVPTKTTPGARLVVAMQSPGVVLLDFVSLFPAKTWRDEPNGLRPDIAEMIAGLKPGFVRFPGGCVVEGGTVETAYDWKLTVGPVERREERWGPWNHRRTNGMGIYEYLRFCSDLGAAPLWVGFCGQTCIFRSRENVPMDQMGPIRDNFLDLVEYANGPVESTWGKLRAEAGRDEPFGLRHVEIGNENQGREYGERYRFVHDAMKREYPDIEYFGDLSWTSPESMGDAQFDIIDRHYYSSVRWFASRFHEYDNRDRNLPPLYLGEVAVTTDEAGPFRGNLRAALAEGVFLLGCERNADAVQMVSYAPLLANLEGRTALTGAPPPWHAMIYFDGNRVFGTASYYLWKLFANHRPDVMLATSVERANAGPDSIVGRFGVGTWDATAEFKDLRIEKDGQTVWQSTADDDARDSTQGGDWSVESGVYRQGRRGYGMKYVGSSDLADCTLTLKARKLSGGEGFLITFGQKGEDRHWWNLGGWGNQQHAVEHNQSIVGEPARGRIDRDRWYDIKIELSGSRVRCYLDGELVHDAVSTPTETFFFTAGQEEQSGDFVLKAVNIGSEPETASVSLGGATGLSTEGEAIVLTADSPRANNSLGSPEAVAPATSTFKTSGGEFSYEFPPNSLTILRLAPETR